MALPKPRIWIVYIREFIEDLELFKDLVRAIYTYSKEDIATIKVYNPTTGEEYTPIEFLISVSTNPNVYAIDAIAIPEYIESSIIPKNRLHLVTDLDLCLKYKGSIVYCHERIGASVKPSQSLVYPFFTASEEALIYRDYEFSAYGDLLYLVGLAEVYNAVESNENLSMIIGVCNKDNPNICNTVVENLFINEDGNFESELISFDRDVYLYQAKVGTPTTAYRISLLRFYGIPENLKPVNFRGGYTNLIKRNEYHTVTVPSPRIRLIEIRDYLRMFRRL
jgi:tetrahydromethanopterin S-methyltransferase subunit F